MPVSPNFVNFGMGSRPVAVGDIPNLVNFGMGSRPVAVGDIPNLVNFGMRLLGGVVPNLVNFGAGTASHRDRGQDRDMRAVLLTVLLLLAVPIPASAGEVLELTPQTAGQIVELSKSTPVVIAWHSADCDWCRPQQDELRRRFAVDLGRWQLVTADISAHPQLRDEYAVCCMPSASVLAGGKEIGRRIGWTDGATMDTFLDDLLAHRPLPVDLVGGTIASADELRQVVDGPNPDPVVLLFRRGEATEPVWALLRAQYPDLTAGRSWTAYTVNLDRLPELADQYKIGEGPALVVVKEKNEVARLSPWDTKPESLRAWLDPLLPAAKPSSAARCASWACLHASGSSASPCARSTSGSPSGAAWTPGAPRWTYPAGTFLSGSCPPPPPPAPQPPESRSR
ncbi:thioredoxin family protein [Pseudonocardiaceae bacterium YIM PH 21723]|nr:thioredoxin family protein [Pseudonocardiaceae bacterium YIM PH 21723]